MNRFVIVGVVALALGLGGCAQLRENPCNGATNTRTLLTNAEVAALAISDPVKREAALGAVRTAIAALDKRCPVPRATG